MSVEVTFLLFCAELECSTKNLQWGGGVGGVGEGMLENVGHARLPINNHSRAWYSKFVNAFLILFKLKAKCRKNDV